MRTSMAKKENTEKKVNVWPWIVLGIVVIVALLWYFQSGKQGVASTVPSVSSTVVATVNGEDITMKELEKEYAQLPPDARLSYTKAMVLNDTIIQTLLLQDAKKKGIVVSDKEVDDTILALTEQFGVTRETFFKELESRGVSEQDAMELFRRRMIVSKLYDQIVGTANVSEADAKQFYDAHPDQFTLDQDMPRLSHILVNSSEQAESLLKQLKQSKNLSEDFAKLAMENSLDTGSAALGGDLNFADKGMFVPAFEEAAFKLQVGQLSDVVKTEFGYHIILATDKKKAGLVPFAEVKGGLIPQMQDARDQQMISKYITDLHNTADIKINYKE